MANMLLSSFIYIYIYIERERERVKKERGDKNIRAQKIMITEVKVFFLI
jgi:hypothetical protein